MQEEWSRKCSATCLTSQKVKARKLVTVCRHVATERFLVLFFLHMSAKGKINPYNSEYQDNQ